LQAPNTGSPGERGSGSRGSAGEGRGTPTPTLRTHDRRASPASWLRFPTPHAAHHPCIRGTPMASTTLDPADLKPTDHYPIISADCHAGARHAVYREYLEQKYLDDFDAWREKYRNPYKDLRATDDRIRNWDNEKRNGDQERDHIVGEVIFPNTVPPFFPSFVLFAPQPTPETYEHRLAGLRAHNRWLVDWCGEFPERRAGIG